MRSVGGRWSIERRLRKSEPSTLPFSSYSRTKPSPKDSKVKHKKPRRGKMWYTLFTFIVLLASKGNAIQTRSGAGVDIFANIVNPAPAAHHAPGGGGGGAALPNLLPFIQYAQGPVQAGGPAGIGVHGDGGGVQRPMWVALRQHIWTWTLARGLQYAGEHPVVTTVVVGTASAAVGWGHRGLDYALQGNDLYEQGCDDYKYLYILDGKPTLRQKWGAAWEGLYSRVTGKRRLQEDLERKEAKERFERNVNDQQAQRERLDKERREREQKMTSAFLRKRAELRGRAGEDDYRRLHNQARIEFVSRLVICLSLVAAVWYSVGGWWAVNVSLLMLSLVAKLVSNVFTEFGLDKVVELLVRAGEGMTPSGQFEAQYFWIGLLSANVLANTLMALLALRLLNGSLHWAAAQYPDSVIIQRLNTWANVRQLWDPLAKMLRLQPASPPEVPFDVDDTVHLSENLFWYVAYWVIKKFNKPLPLSPNEGPVSTNDRVTETQANYINSSLWLMGVNVPAFPYPNGHVPQDDLTDILANVPGPQQEAFLQWLEYRASVELGPPEQFPASQVQAGAVNAGLDLLQNYR